MKNELLKAELKQQIKAVLEVDTKSLGEDWLYGEAVISEAKKRLLAEIKVEMHKKISTLDMEDIKFEFIKR